MSRAVLITGARAPVALDLARSFRAAGLEPHLADSVPAHMTRLSRAPTAVHRIAPPRHDPEGFRRDIGRLVEGLNPLLIVPTCEEVFHLAAHTAALGVADRLFAPPLGTLRRLHGKADFAELCRDLGLDSPETRRLSDSDQLAALTDEGGSLVFKPEFSRAGVQALIRPNPAILQRVRPTPSRPWCAQAYVAGREVCFYAIAHEGRLAAFVAYEPRWQMRGGASYAFAPVDGALSDRLRAMAAVLASVVVTGQFACDAIVDDAGRPWLIECNPRATSGVHLFGRGPALARAMLDGTRAEPEPGLRYLGPAMAIFGLPAALASGRLGPWRADVREGGDVIGAPGDGAPVVGALLDSAAFQVAALGHGRSLAAERTADIEWNGEPIGAPS